ncbi:hypothetical protein BRC83_09345 [Halobacteriales archaeon QS_1_68_17]|nr:MAG: hypothetical protein BRC83_09345 [Halobacteriales archaeon QS_1_68_17]
MNGRSLFTVLVVLAVTTTAVPVAGSHAPSAPAADATERHPPPGPAHTGGAVQAAEPPGVSGGQLTNATALVAAHTDAVVAAGFVSTTNASGTVLRNGIRLDVESEQETTVAPDRSTYRRTRTTVAGPGRRVVDAWADERVEYQRRTLESGTVRFDSREPRPSRELAGGLVLEPLLRGAEFTVETVTETPNGTRIVLVADEVADEAAIRESLPAEVGNVSGFEARAVVDPDGRIHSLNATTDYELRGRTESSSLTYRLRETGTTTVPEPTWLDSAREAANAAGGSRG